MSINIRILGREGFLINLESQVGQDFQPMGMFPLGCRGNFVRRIEKAFQMVSEL